jgi:spore germination protein GerM
MKRLKQGLLLLSLVLAGLWTRSLLSMRVDQHIPRRWPWESTRTVTLYFTDGHLLVPVSRRMPAGGDLPRATLQALIAGPRPGTNLMNPIPLGAEIRSIKVTDKVANVDLSAAFRDGRDMQAAEAAIVETLTELPGITSVVLNVEGKPLPEPQRRTPLLYYASANGLVAIPSDAADPRSALAAYLSGPSSAEFTGLPADVRILKYDYNPADGLLSLNFKYTPSLHELALEKPERIRLALLGLIATLTEFPEVRSVQLDFEGHTRLGLGQCSDLLRTPQPRPELLNDERLLGR